MPKLNAIRITSVIIIIFSAYFYHLTLRFPAGAAMLPRGLLILLALCAVGLLVRSIMGKGGNESLGIKNYGRLLMGTSLLVLYILGINAIGYYIASSLFVILVTLLLGYRKWHYIAIAAIGFSVAVYVVFEYALKIPMP